MLNNLIHMNLAIRKWQLHQRKVSYRQREKEAMSYMHMPRMEYIRRLR